jgi:hypothetical protein
MAVQVWATENLRLMLILFGQCKNVQGRAHMHASVHSLLAGGSDLYCLLHAHVSLETSVGSIV